MAEVSGRLRVASFNLENLGAGPDLTLRRAVLRPQLERLDADLLCLQEVQAEHPPGGGPRTAAGLAEVLAGTAYAGFHSSIETIGQKLADIHNLVVLSRFPLERARLVREELVTPPSFTARSCAPTTSIGCGFDRPLLHAVIKLPAGRRLHVVNLHLRAPLAAPVPGQKAGPFAWRSIGGWAEGFLVAAIKRAGQALEARLLIERLFDAEPEAWVLVAGDLNAEDREVPLRILAAETADTGNGALAPRSLVPLERSLPLDRRASVVHHGRRLMLDHILVSRPLLGRFRSFEVHDETLDDELAPANRTTAPSESYHAPVVAEFAL
jgi:endonuclease/exonuclease/phosphatase family metal-dependent hydrolase